MIQIVVNINVRIDNSNQLSVTGRFSLEHIGSSVYGCQYGCTVIICAMRHNKGISVVFFIHQLFNLYNIFNFSSCLVAVHECHIFVHEYQIDAQPHISEIS